MLVLSIAEESAEPGGTFFKGARAVAELFIVIFLDTGLARMYPLVPIIFCKHISGRHTNFQIRISKSPNPQKY